MGSSHAPLVEMLRRTASTRSCPRIGELSCIQRPPYDSPLLPLHPLTLDHPSTKRRAFVLFPGCRCSRRSAEPYRGVSTACDWPWSLCLTTDIYRRVST